MQSVSLRDPLSGKHLFFSYDVVHHENFTNIDDDARIVQLDCLDERLSTAELEDYTSSSHDADFLFLTAEDAVSWAHSSGQVGHLLGGVKKVKGCSGGKFPQRSALRRIQSVESNLGLRKSEDGAVFVSLRTRIAPAQLTEVLQHAKASMRSNHSNYQHFEGMHPHSSSPRALGEVPPLGCWFCVFSSVVEAVADTFQVIAQKVESVVEDVWTVLKALVTGDYSYEKTFSVGSVQYNYNPSTGHAQAPIVLKNKTSDSMTEIICSDCYLSVDTEVVLELDIQDYSLLSADTHIEGGVAVGASGQIDSVIDFVFADDVQIGQVSMDPIYFQLGPVPLVITFTIPVYVGYNITIRANSTFHANTTIVGSAAFGVQYDQNNGWAVINNRSLNSGGDMPALSEDISVSATVFLRPVFVFEVDHLGGANVGVEGSLTFNAEASTSSSCPPVFNGSPFGLQMSFSADVQTTIGATLLIEFPDSKPIFNKTFGPVSIYHIPIPIWSGCLVFGSHADDDFHHADDQDDDAPIHLDDYYPDMDDGHDDYRPPSNALSRRVLSGNQPRVRSIDGTRSYALQQPGLVLSGQTWHGVTFTTDPNNPACASQPAYEEDSLFAFYKHGQLYFLLTSSTYDDDLGHCALQVLMMGTYPNNNTLTISPVKNNAGWFEKYVAHCDRHDNTKAEPAAVSYTVAPDHNSFTITTICGTETLSRVDQGLRRGL